MSNLWPQIQLSDKGVSDQPQAKAFYCPGCVLNPMVLNGVLHQSKTERRALAVVFIDIAKAFDSVAHEHLIRVLKERGLDSHIIRLIKDSYEEVCTRIKVKEGTSPPIEMKVGVKQGDPMSPLLFNIAVDPMIHKLVRMGEGYRFRGVR